MLAQAAGFESTDDDSGQSVVIVDSGKKDKKGSGKGGKGDKRSEEDVSLEAEVVSVVSKDKPKLPTGSYLWGPWLLSPLKQKSGGPQTGRGGTCWLHWGMKDGQRSKTECKINLPYTAYGQTLTDEDCQLVVKRWLLTGLQYDPEIQPDDRHLHIWGCRPRSLTEHVEGEDRADPTPLIPEKLCRHTNSFRMCSLRFHMCHMLLSFHVFHCSTIALAILIVVFHVSIEKL